MMKCKFGLVLALSASLLSFKVGAAEMGSQERGMSQAMTEAVWPADIAKAAAQYEMAFPQGAQIDEARLIKHRAEASMLKLMRSDIRLFRSTVIDASADKVQAPLVRKAMLGDGDAALKLSHLAAKQSASRYVGWLQWATAVGSDKAAYELALHFRAQGQPLFASQYEAKAVALGFVPPPVLDHVRR